MFSDTKKGNYKSIEKSSDLTTLSRCINQTLGRFDKFILGHYSAISMGKYINGNDNDNRF